MLNFLNYNTSALPYILLLYTAVCTCTILKFNSNYPMLYTDKLLIIIIMHYALQYVIYTYNYYAQIFTITKLLLF